MLLLSLFTMPQMIAETHTKRFMPMMMMSVTASILCSVCGLIGSYLLNVPASSTIVLMLILVYIIARIAKNIGNKYGKKTLLN